MQTYSTTLATGQVYNVSVSPWYDFLEIVSANGTLSVNASGGTQGGTVLMRQGDTIHFEGRPTQISFTSTVNNDAIEIRAGRGFSMSLKNVVTSVSIGLVDVQGPYLQGTVVAAVNPVIGGFQRSNQVEPFQSLDGTSLDVITPKPTSFNGSGAGNFSFPMQGDVATGIITIPSGNTAGSTITLTGQIAGTALQGPIPIYNSQGLVVSAAGVVPADTQGVYFADFTGFDDVQGAAASSGTVNYAVGTSFRERISIAAAGNMPGTLSFAGRPIQFTFASIVAGTPVTMVPAVAGQSVYIAGFDVSCDNSLAPEGGYWQDTSATQLNAVLLIGSSANVGFSFTASPQRPYYLKTAVGKGLQWNNQGAGGSHDYVNLAYYQF